MIPSQIWSRISRIRITLKIFPIKYLCVNPTHTFRLTENIYTDNELVLPHNGFTKSSVDLSVSGKCWKVCDSLEFHQPMSILSSNFFQLDIGWWNSKLSHTFQHFSDTDKSTLDFVNPLWGNTSSLSVYILSGNMNVCVGFTQK